MGFFSKLFHRDNRGKEFPIKMEKGALKEANACMEKVLSLKDEWVTKACDDGRYNTLLDLPEASLRRVISWALWKISKSDDYALNKMQNDVFVKGELDQTDVAVAIKILAYRNYGTKVLADISQKSSFSTKDKETAVKTLLDLVGLTNQIGDAAQLSRRFYYGWRDYFNQENIKFDQVNQIALSSGDTNRVQKLVASTKQAKEQKQKEAALSANTEGEVQTVRAVVGSQTSNDEPQPETDKQPVEQQDNVTTDEKPAEESSVAKEETKTDKPTLGFDGNNKPSAGIVLTVGEDGAIQGATNQAPEQPAEGKDTVDAPKENSDKKTPMLHITRDVPQKDQDHVKQLVAQTKRLKKQKAQSNNDTFSPLSKDNEEKMTQEAQDEFNQANERQQKRKSNIVIKL